MATTRTYSRSFNGGEVSPEFYGRLDDAKFQAGLGLCRNFVILPHGPAQNRAGFEFVRAVKSESKRTRLLRFTYSSEQTLVLEFGEGYFRFHTLGGTVLSGASPYELPHPYTEAQLFDVRYVQSADVVTLVHPAHPPRELRRLGATNWQLADIVFATLAPAPSGVTAVATVPSGTVNLRVYRYLVTGLKDGQESALPPFATCGNNLNTADAYNTISWTAAASPVDGYNVYRQESGVWAFIGQVDAASLTLQDEGILADVSRTPATQRNPFNAPGNYPSAVTYFEQRRAFAATLNAPQTLWMTRSGTESNMDVSFPVRDDDAVTFRIAAREANAIRHLVPLQDLMVLTQSAEWRVAEDITPSSIKVRPQSFIGSSPVEPLVVNSTLVFPSGRGGHVRELGYQNEVGGYTTSDMSLRATHLFDDYVLVDSAQSKAPVPVCWFVSSDGRLLGVTYIPEQSIAAWHWHDTQSGAFESIAVVAEGEEDVLYAVVRRTINGEQRRYVERMASRKVQTPTAEDGFFVDAGVRYEGAPITSLSEGLAHLEGETVSILVDGAVQPEQRVASGTVSWPVAGTKVVIGLPVVADLKTLPFAIEIQGYGQGRRKNITEVWLRLFESRSVLAGPGPSKLYEMKPRINEDMGLPPDLITGEASLRVSPEWQNDGALFIRHDQPLPLTVLSMTMELDIAG